MRRDKQCSLAAWAVQSLQSLLRKRCGIGGPANDGLRKPQYVPNRPYELTLELSKLCLIPRGLAARKTLANKQSVKSRRETIFTQLDLSSELFFWPFHFQQLLQ